MTPTLCVLCGESLADNAKPAHVAINWLNGHNPDPLAPTGRACDKCNDALVIPARLFGLAIGDK
jgi:hypothetical protein|tara:strand:+ start:1570 stop:1761 length:192 start_codon:yes stop_codon:yes gene_type:complete